MPWYYHRISDEKSKWKRVYNLKKYEKIFIEVAYLTFIVNSGQSYSFKWIAE